MNDVPVIIVGGGPVGLTASILLSQAGIGSLLVERHAGTAVHPKARAINGRTMEIFHQCGVEAAIRSAGLSPQQAMRSPGGLRKRRKPLPACVNSIPIFAFPI